MTTLAEIRAALELALASDAIVAHRLVRDLLARLLVTSLPADGVIVTPDSLARALGGSENAHHTAANIMRSLAALAAEGGPR